MIQLDLDKSRLDDEQYVLQAVNTLFVRKVIEGQTQRYKTCFDFYMGIEPQTSFKEDYDYRCRVINLTKPIVDTATETFIGELPDIVSSGKKAEKDKISVFNQKLYNRQFSNHIYETLHYSSKCGTGFLALYNLQGDTFPRFREINPKFAEVVYDCSLEQKPLFAFYIVEKNDGDTITGSKYIIYVYTDKKIFAFESPLTYVPQSTVPNADKQVFVIPYFAWKKTNGEEVSSVEHGFGDIPIVEFPNNADYIGDAECVFDLISLYNEVTNNRCKNLYDVVNYILMIKNVRLGDDEETQKVVEMLKRHHILPVEGENVDAKFLTNPINQDQMQTLANSIKDTIHYICRVPDLSSVDFSQNASDPIIKIKTKPLLDLCKDKEKKCTGAYLRVIKMIMNWCKNNSSDFEEFNFDTDIITLKYTHTLPSNDNDMITMITNLQNSSMANPEVLLQELSFIPNVHEYIKGMKKWNESVDLRKKDLQNNNESGVNETNIERQNSTPLTTGQMRNKQNFNEGNADTQSELK
jgi:SPP1 family phage portal protein